MKIGNTEILRVHCGLKVYEYAVELGVPLWGWAAEILAQSYICHNKRFPAEFNLSEQLLELIKYRYGNTLVG
jgi:hypothetical protein